MEIPIILHQFILEKITYVRGDFNARVEEHPSSMCYYKNHVSGAGSAVSTLHMDTKQPIALNYVCRTQLQSGTARSVLMFQGSLPNSARVRVLYMLTCWYQYFWYHKINNNNNGAMWATTLIRHSLNPYKNLSASSRRLLVKKCNRNKNTHLVSIYKIRMNFLLCNS